jgi:hypothetical protein
MNNSQDKKQEFHDVIEKLIPLGEDEKELRFWEAIFNNLSESEKDDVLKNLKAELAALLKSEPKK